MRAARRAGPAHAAPAEIALRLLMLSWASLHTSANTLAHALLRLPASARALRAERAPPAQRPLLGSFLKEVLRVDMVGAGAFSRKVMRRGGHTFSSGLAVPGGTYVCVAAREAHLAVGAEFDAARYVDGGKDVGVTATSDTFMSFGGGSHAW